jgi:hypothetical protein
MFEKWQNLNSLYLAFSSSLLIFNPLYRVYSSSLSITTIMILEDFIMSFPFGCYLKSMPVLVATLEQLPENVDQV